MTKATKENIIRYLKSSGITFLAGFILAVGPMLNDITPETIRDGALVGIIFAGFRAGLKGLFELVMTWISAK